MSLIRGTVVWGLLAAVIAVPVAQAMTSPLLQWRDPVYIGAGLAGVAAMVILLLQPLLAWGVLPGLRAPRGRRFHRWTGAALVGAVVAHVGALWITSPPDVVDALLFASPTPFSLWGVIAMWAVFAAGALALFRRRLRIGPKGWRRGHAGLAVIIVSGSVLHALLIEGTMETVSKAALCGLVIFAGLAAFLGPGLLRKRRPTG